MRGHLTRCEYSFSSREDSVELAVANSMALRCLAIMVVETVDPLLRLTAVQGFKCQQRLGDLAPQCGFVAAQTIERQTRQISQSQKATCYVEGAGRFTGWPGSWVGTHWRHRFLVIRSSRGLSKERIHDLTGLGRNAASLSQVCQMLSLDFKQTCFHGCGAAQPPEQARKPQHQFPLDGDWAS